MSIPVAITKSELKTLKKELRKEQDFICLDDATYIKANLVGLQLCHAGELPKAKIIRAAKS
jgi:hypothetical protein